MDTPTKDTKKSEKADTSSKKTIGDKDRSDEEKQLLEERRKIINQINEFLNN